MPQMLTLLDLAKRTHMGSLIDIAEVLNRATPILMDAAWQEANGLNSHTIARRASLPEGTWRMLNQGVKPTKSDVVQIVEPIALLEDWSQVDIEEINLAPNGKLYRYQEDIAHVEGMGHQLEEAYWYENAKTNPAAITGLANRYADVSMDEVFNVGGSSSGSMTSIWIVEHGPQATFFVYPRGNRQLGISMEDRGMSQLVNAQGEMYDVFRTKFKAYAGIAIRDTRCVKRVCNMVMTQDGLKAAIKKMREALNRLPGTGTPAIYISKGTKDLFDNYVDEKTNVVYQANDPFGRPVMTFNGITMRTCDALLETEATVS